MDVPEKVLKSLQEAKTVLIQLHNKPDGDALGSGIAMGLGLKQLGKDVDYYIDTNFEPKLDFFDEINNFNQPLKDHYDVLLLLDCSTRDYSPSPEVEPEHDKLVVIDHHKSNKFYGDENFVYETGATGELVYQVLEKLGINLEEEICKALFTSISSDTGSFQFNNVTPQTHQIASKLYEQGYTYAPISKRIHAQKNIDQLKLYGEAINNVELFEDGKIVLVNLPYELIEKYGGSRNVTDDLSNIGMNIDTSMVSILAKETEPGVLKLSMRSKSPYNIDMSELALEYNGGGHFNAAGANFNGSYEELKEEILPKLKNLIEKV